MGKVSTGKVQRSPLTTLIAGGGAGMMEVLACHPLDTVKVNMQLSSASQNTKRSNSGLLKTVTAIARQSPLAFYKGFGPVFVGIIPKMGIRFTSFEACRSMLATTATADPNSCHLTNRGTFVAGLAAGITEAVTVVTTMEVIKVRLQAQDKNKAQTSHAPKYLNTAHVVSSICKEEGPAALFKGMSLTALRQATNVSVNFTAYTKLKQSLQALQPKYEHQELPSVQTALCGLVAGAAGPLSNAPIDTLKTLTQRHPTPPNHSSFSHTTALARHLYQQEGLKALYKGITPRIMRLAPGQAITYTIYEYLKAQLST